jgi:hypothetical protein
MHVAGATLPITATIRSLQPAVIWFFEIQVAAPAIAAAPQPPLSGPIPTPAVHKPTPELSSG